LCWNPAGAGKRTETPSLCFKAEKLYGGLIKMGKISPVSAKYIVHANIQIEGVVDRPDVIGAIFGQTEGLLGADLELRELQRSGRIGRIEVAYDTKGGKTFGTIQIPSSLDKAETAIVAASLEVIQRIGPCDAKINVQKIEDVRISKRKFIVDRAKELLKYWISSSMPDSQELSEEVAHSVRMMEVQEYGKERLPAGPAVDESDEVVVVEGRADVLNLLKYGIKNVIGMNGTNMPQTIIDLSKKKTITLFVDGDRGGDLIVKGMLRVAEIDFVAKAPDGKEVEEITQKEILKALRGKIAVEQATLEVSESAAQKEANGRPHHAEESANEGFAEDDFHSRNMKARMMGKRPVREPEARLSQEQSDVFRQTAEELIGTRGACIFDDKLNVLGKLPIAELYSTLKNINSGIEAIIFDGIIDRELVRLAEHANIKILIGMESKVRPNETRIRLATVNEL